MSSYSKITVFVADDLMEEIAEAAQDMGVNEHALINVALARFVRGTGMTLQATKNAADQFEQEIEEALDG